MTHPLQGPVLEAAAVTSSTVCEDCVVLLLPQWKQGQPPPPPLLLLQGQSCTCHLACSPLHILVMHADMAVSRVTESTYGMCCSVLRLHTTTPPVARYPPCNHSTRALMPPSLPRAAHHDPSCGHWWRRHVCGPQPGAHHHWQHYRRRRVCGGDVCAGAGEARPHHPGGERPQL